MKPTLVFLIAICTLTVNAGKTVFEPKEFQLIADKGFLETIQEYIEKLDRKAQDEMDAVTKVANKIAINLSDELQNILISTLSIVNEIIIKLEEELLQLSDQGEHVKECVEKYHPELVDLVIEAKNNIKKCINDSAEHIQHIPDSIHIELDAIKEQISLLHDLIRECFEPSRPVSSVKCAYEKGTEIAKTIKAIVKSAYEDLKAATIETVNIVAATNECVQSALAQSKQHAKNILENINKCVHSQ